MYFLPLFGLIDTLSTIPVACVISFIGDTYVHNHRALSAPHHRARAHRACPRLVLLEAMMRDPDLYIYTQRFRRPLTFNRMTLSWLQALDECEREGRPYTELHFYRHPETGETVITYWEID